MKARRLATKLCLRGDFVTMLIARSMARMAMRVHSPIMIVVIDRSMVEAMKFAFKA